MVEKGASASLICSRGLAVCARTSAPATSPREYIPSPNGSFLPGGRYRVFLSHLRKPRCTRTADSFAPTPCLHANRDNHKCGIRSSADGPPMLASSLSCIARTSRHRDPPSSANWTCSRIIASAERRLLHLLGETCRSSSSWDQVVHLVSSLIVQVAGDESVCHVPAFDGHLTIMEHVCQGDGMDGADCMRLVWSGSCSCNLRRLSWHCKQHQHGQASPIQSRVKNQLQKGAGSIHSYACILVGFKSMQVADSDKSLTRRKPPTTQSLHELR